MKDWRRRVDSYSLYFDVRRSRMIQQAMDHGVARVEDVLPWFHDANVTMLPGHSRGSVPSDGTDLRPGEPLIDGYTRILRDRLSNSTPYDEWGTPDIRSVIATGVVPWELQPVGLEWAACVAMYLHHACNFNAKLFLADAELVSDVLVSTNEPIKYEDLGQLPFPVMWVEFDRPVEFAQKLMVRAVAFWSHPTCGLRAVTLVSDTSCNTAGYQLKYDANACMFFLFWEGRCILSTCDEALRQTLNVPEYRDGRGTVWEEYQMKVRRAVRNIYDFLTCRSFDYTTKERPERGPIKRLRHLSGNASGPRHYRVVHLNKEIAVGDQLTTTVDIGTLTQVDVPGCFHRWVYCRACGDTHRHDLIGRPCRKCGVAVGPVSNVRIEKWWHAPHTRGNGVRKEYVRHMVP